MISKSIRCLAVLICVIAFPLWAASQQQTETTATAAIQTVGTNPNPPGGHLDHPLKPASEKAKRQGINRPRVHAEATRLAALRRWDLGSWVEPKLRV